MVSKAIDDGLLARIRKYIANDINSKIVMVEGDERYEVKEKDIYILSFNRVLNNWTCTATAQSETAGYYTLVYDGAHNQCIVTIYLKHATQEAVI